MTTSAQKWDHPPWHLREDVQAPSARRDLFFNGFASAARLASALVLVGQGRLEFVLTAPNGVATQTGDFGDMGDAAVSVLEGQEAGYLTTGFFIQGRQQLIDCRMLLCNGIRWLPTTCWAGAAIHWTI